VAGIAGQSRGEAGRPSLAWLRERLRLAVRGRAAKADPAAYAYRIHWLAQARTWTPARRAEVLAPLRRLTSSPGFRPVEGARIYEIPELDSQKHAGASLVELLTVLEALLTPPAHLGGEHGR
jgi:hypothetical protein